MLESCVLGGGSPQRNKSAKEQGMPELEGIVRALVVGMGISGKAAAEKLLREGKQVTVNDISTAEAVERVADELSAKGALVALGHHQFDLLDDLDLVVVSPGIRSRLPLLAEAESRGIPIWSEIELAWRFARGPVVAVTGTNGKTTTVRMIEWIFKSVSRPVIAAGNIGYPFVRAVEEAGEEELLVVEVSSFQLAYVKEFRPKIAVLLNIAEDHFDWHDHLQEYIDAKGRVWMNQGEGDLVVCNLDDPLCLQAAQSAPSRVAYFSRQPDEAATIFLSGGVIYCNATTGVGPEREPVEIVSTGLLPLPGEHNLENAMAAAAAAIYMGVDPEAVGKALRDFSGLPHRIQLVAEVGGVRFYNDSKATNPHAAMRALSAFENPIVVILGGRNKGLGFDELAMELDRRRQEGGIRSVYLIGEAAGEIGETIERVSPLLKAKTFTGLEEVFHDLPDIVETGDVVLFSPACASFDRYADYKERGKHFQKIVEDYGKGREKDAGPGRG
jgi:UDP-N-acetylmuramoylalanine--D-glutamate ligase